MTSDRQKMFSGTTAVREQHRFDTARLESWMAGHVEGFAGPLSVEQFKGGQSNPTYKLVTPGKSYVLRRKPPGELLASAHAVDREYRVITALGQHTDVPVARSYALCEDDDVVGTAFYIMDMVEGRVIWDTTFPEVSAADRPLYFDAMNEAIARLHNVDFKAIGLESYGKAGNYFARQVRRWSGQYQQDEDAGRFDSMDRMTEWLPGNIPEGDEASIVHGDFRSDNMIFHPTEPKVLAILDWELSTLGHPLADFSYHAMMYHMPPVATSGLVGADLKELNIPPEEDYVAAYCQRTGRGDVPPATWDFCIAFNLFRLAAILHGIRGRVVRGTAASANARSMADMVGPLADLAWQKARRLG